MSPNGVFWTASVNRATGRTLHTVAGPGGPEAIPDPSSLKIEPPEKEGDGYLLLRLDASGTCLADTWHATLEEAKTQAEFEYEVAPSAWTEKAE